MKVYIKIKRNRNLRLHQPFNKRIGLMKRERTHRTLHHFSFGERFDETMMNIYHFGYQFIILSTHQFIGFSSANKFAGQMDGRKCHYPQAGRSDIRPACCPTSRQGKAYHINEKKRAAYTAGTLTGFWEQKSHSSLGRFLHAPLTLMLKTPQWANGVTPSGHPPLPCGMTAADGNQQTKLSNLKTKNKHGIYKHSNQQSERLGWHGRIRPHRT